MPTNVPPNYVVPTIVITSDMTLSKVAEAALGAESIALDPALINLLRVNDEDQRFRRAHDPEAVANMQAVLESAFGEYSNFSGYAEQVRYPYYSLEPYSFARYIMTSLICIHARGRDACGLEVVTLLTEMTNAQVYPEIAAFNIGDDLKHALRSVGWCLTGAARVLQRGGPKLAEMALTDFGLNPVRAELVAHSKILRENALVLACALRSFQSLCELEIVQQKNVRVSAALWQRLDDSNLVQKSMKMQKLSFERTLELGTATEMMSEFAIRFGQAKRALTLHLRLAEDARHHSLESNWTIEAVLIDLVRAVLRCCDRSAKKIFEIADQYKAVIRRWKSGPYAIESHEHLAHMFELNIARLQAAVAIVTPQKLTDQQPRMARYFILGQLEEVVQLWKKVLATETIVLAELINSGPWRHDDFYAPLLRWTELYSPFKNRAKRPVDLEITLAGTMLVDLLEDIPLP